MKKILVLIGVLFLLTGCFSNPEEEPTPESLKNNIEVKTEKYLDNELLFVKNNNSKNVSINLEIDYLNNEDTIIYNDAKNILSVAGNSEIVLRVDNVPEEYKESKINYDVSVPTYIKDYSEDIKIEETKDKSISTKVKNTGDNEINNISIGIVYYNNKKIVGYDVQTIIDLKKDETKTIDFFNPMDKDHSYVFYNDYKIYVNYAYSFDYNN